LRRAKKKGRHKIPTQRKVAKFAARKAKGSHQKSSGDKRPFVLEISEKKNVPDQPGGTTKTRTVDSSGGLSIAEKEWSHDARRGHVD